MSHDGPRPMGDAERARMGRKHIFAVNGDPDLLNLMRVLFQNEEFNVTTTNYVPDTFDQIASFNPDILLVDLVYGERAGWELLERLRREARTRDIPVVILSTTGAYLDRARGDHARYGGDAFIGKPFDVDDIIGAVHRLIGTA